jgi:hypothetical protein
MSKSTITITITIDGGNVSVSTAGGGSAKSGGKSRRSNEAIPPGGSTRLMPGKKGKDEGLTLGEASMDDLTWWADKIASGLRDDPNSRYADKNRDDLAELKREIARRTGGVSDEPGEYGPESDDEQSIPF